MTEAIETLRAEVRQLFAGESSGHDYFHTERVCRTALQLARDRSCDRTLVAAAALVHDVDDPKLFQTEQHANARALLCRAGFDESFTARVLAIVENLSFAGDGCKVPASLEGKLVQDADRLDALGAIGIARAFAYGGSRGRALYDPDEPPRRAESEEEYHSRPGTTVNHFYEKLLLLRSLMNTPEGRALAETRTRIMQAFLDEFYAEWNGEA